MAGSLSWTRDRVSLPGTLPGRIAAFFLLTTVYYGAGRAGLALAFVHVSASAVWPPTGIALAAFLVLGRWVWPAVLVGAFLVNLATAGSIATSAAIACGNTLESLLGAALVVRFAGGLHCFDGTRNILRYVLLAAGAATAVSATIGVTTLVLGGLAGWEAFGRIWLTWWLGDAAGAMIVAPALVLWAVEPRPSWNRQQLAEVALLLAGLLAAAFVVFHGVLPAPLMLACVPFPLWAAFRFGQREAATTTLLLSAFAVWGTLAGFGPFVRPSVHESLLLLQAFTGLLSMMILAVAAIVARAQRIERELRAARVHLERSVDERTHSLSEAVRALEQSELRLRGLLEAAPDAMLVIDPAGTLKQVTAQAERMFGHSRQELLGRPVEDFVPGFRAAGDGHELLARRRDGGLFPVEISRSPVRTDEGLLVMAAVRDITERKQVEQRIRRINAELERRVGERTAALERSNEALRQFAYAASHDLQEPLRTMGSYAELVAARYRGKLDADADEFLGYIVDGAEWMHQLLQGLLTYSRIEMRRLPSAPAPMGQALEHALENLGAAVAETGARISAGPLPAVPADELQMVQLFQNLVANAIKFRTADVPPEVWIEASERDEEWVFSVQDNGIGVDPRHAERVFGMFQRLHRREEFPGAGVGLAICKKIVERHGGRIWVQPRAGGGSDFRFTLPRVAAEAP